MFKMKWIAHKSIYSRLMAWLAHFSINRRLLLASVIVAIIPGLVVALLGSAHIQALNAHGQAVQVSTDAVKVATMQLANLKQMNGDLVALESQNFVANRSETEDAHVRQLGQDLKNEIDKLRGICGQTLIRYQHDYQIATADNMVSVRGQLRSSGTFGALQGDQQSTLALVIDREWPAYLQTQRQDLQALKSDQSSAQAYQLQIAAINEKFAPLEKDWSHIIALAETVSDNVALVGAAYKFDFIALGVVACLFILLVVIIIGYIINISIVRPLQDLVKLTKRISQGDTTARIEIRGNDEIYLVASSINTMLDNIVQLIQEIQTQRDVLQGKIENMLNEMRGIGEGNLQVQPEVTPDTLGALAVFFNDMIEALSDLIIRVKMASREVEASTTVTLTMLAQLVNTSNMQLQETTEAMVEVVQMANSSRQVAERTRMLYSVVRDAQSAIEKGRISVKQAINGMRRIHENVHETATKVQKLDAHSEEISDISTVISTISQQMRSLAQDAAMQASLVGDHGKGFAVVANDIQRLAERTASQVSSIAQIVQGVHGDIGSVILSMQSTERESEHGAKLVQEASNSLETIFAAAEIQAREMDVINHMTTQQLQSFNAIENVMCLISQSTQQVSTITCTVSQNLEYLTRHVEELLRSVEAFKLRQTSPAPKSIITADPVTSVPSHASQLLERWGRLVQ